MDTVRNLLTAQEFRQQGGMWNPNILWLMGVRDTAIEALLQRYAAHIEAYDLSDVGGIKMLELHVSGKTIANEMQQSLENYCKAEAEAARNKRAYIKKRLPKRRMYRLPQTGQAFLYLSGLPYEKVQGKVLGSDDTLHDLVIPRPVLEAAELIEEGQEPWGMTDGGNYQSKNL